MRPMAALLCATVIVVGCSAPTRQTANPASPLVTAVATTSPTSSAAVTSTASPTPTAVPTSARTPVPVIAKKLNIAWKADDPVGLPAVSSVVDVVHTDDGYVLVTERYEDEENTFEAWWSGDGRTWTLAHRFPDNQRINALTAGGPGFVLAGSNGADAVIWTSKDGRDWQAVTNPGLQGGFI